jgi:hypothetical protein
MTFADLQEKRASLVDALSEGVLRVVIHSNGARREVEYRSIADIERAIGAIDRELAANSGTRINTFPPYSSKGLD